MQNHNDLTYACMIINRQHSAAVQDINPMMKQVSLCSDK